MSTSCCVDVQPLIVHCKKLFSHNVYIDTHVRIPPFTLLYICFSIYLSYIPLLNLFLSRDNTWLGFGLSGSPEQTLMFGADASIVWVDDEKGPQAVDYHLSAYTQVSCGISHWPL